PVEQVVLRRDVVEHRLDLSFLACRFADGRFHGFASLWHAHCVRCGSLAMLAVVRSLCSLWFARCARCCRVPGLAFPTTATEGSEQKAEGRTTSERSERTTACHGHAN